MPVAETASCEIIASTVETDLPNNMNEQYSSNCEDLVNTVSARTKL